MPIAEALYGCETATDGTDALRSLFMSSSPHPSCFQLKEDSLSQLSIAFTWSGISCGYRWSRSATAPETNAVASEVPLPRK